MSSLNLEGKPLKLAPGRPKCNSIFHLFGEWLFEAAFIGTDLPQRKFHVCKNKIYTQIKYFIFVALITQL